MSRTRRNGCRWLVELMHNQFNHDCDYNKQVYITKAISDNSVSGYLKSIPRYFRKTFNKSKRYHDKREIKRMIKYPNHDDNFSLDIKDAGYWWY